MDAHRVQEDFLKDEFSKALAAVSKTGNQAWSNGFRTAFVNEILRITKFANDSQIAFEVEAKNIFLQANAIATAEIESIQECNAKLHNLRESTRKIADECIDLQAFFSSSRKTFFDMAKAADEQLQGSPRYSSIVHDHLARPHINSSLVCIVSDIYDALRVTEEKILTQNNSTGTAMWQAPSSFERSTTKYWVKDENLTKLMMICAAEAPLLVYGKQGPLTSIDPKDLKVSDGDKLWGNLATKITSIYFDAHDMSLYKERLKRAEGAQLLRARWYGPTMPTGDKIIFLELKTHHEKWVKKKSVKERASIKEKDMVNFLKPNKWTQKDAEAIVLRAKPNMKSDDLPKAVDLLLRMHALVEQHKITACVRSVYDRAAFQSAKSNDLRLTLDRNVTLINERVPRTSASSGWCLSDTEAQTANISVVPFNVFEVKLAGDDPMPAGLEEAIHDSTIEVATKFSKFLTGAAAFNIVPTLLYWATHFAFYSFFGLGAKGVPKPAPDAVGYAVTDVMATTKLPDGTLVAPRKPTRIEPKTFFANERTFVQWISASSLLLSVSSLLMDAGNFQTTAAVISFSAMCLVVYSVQLYFRRLLLLSKRQPYGYFDTINPVFLTTVVIIAVVLVWADSVKGSDLLGFRGEKQLRRMLRSLPEHLLQKELTKCPSEVLGAQLQLEDISGSLFVDSERQSFLLTSGESIYIQSMPDDAFQEATSLLRIHQSHLQGLVAVEDRLFVISDGPDRTELIEVAWYGIRDEHLRVIGRWTLLERPSQVAGFTYVPSADGGSFYVHVDSSVQVYSVPDHRVDPVRLKSLNMKVLGHGERVEEQGLAAWHTFEGITYILKPKENILEAWNMTSGSYYSEVSLPETQFMTEWTGFSLEKRRDSSTDSLLLHLMSEDPAFGSQVWSFPASWQLHDNFVVLTVPECRIGGVVVD